MIRVKDLSEHYQIWSPDRGKNYRLYLKEGYGRYNTRKYLANAVKWKNGHYQIDGFAPTNKIEVLNKNVEEKQKSYKYNSEFYDPSYREGYFEEIVVTDYLRSKGFEWDGCWDDTVTFVLKRNNIYKGPRETVVMHIEGLESLNEIKKTVKISMPTGDWSWVSTNEVPRTADAIIELIDSLLKPLFATNSVADLKESQKYTMADFEPTLKSLRGFNVVEQNTKEELITELENILAELKQ